MKWLNYLKKTSFAQICVDWKEYKKLRQQRNVYRRAYNKWDTEITQRVTCDGRKCFYVVRDNYRIFRPMRKVVYCKKFYERECHEDCSLVDVHDDYWYCLDMYNQKRQAVADFWRDKFQSVK